MQAEADRARAMQLERQRRLLDQYERRRAAAHARIRSEQSSTLYASTPSPAHSQLSCPVEPVAHTPGIFDSIFSERADGTLLISIGDGRPTVPGSRGDSAAPPYWPETLMPVVPQPSAALDLAVPNADFPSLDPRDGLASAGTAAVHAIPFLPAASAALERRGFVHVVNHSAQAGEVRIEAVDDSGRRYGPLTLELQPHATFRFDSIDLENGNADKGLLGGTGQGVGDWRLELSSDLDIEALSYIRTTDGLLTAMHDVVPSEGTRHHVATFDSGSNSNRESRLRLVNPGTEPADVAITGIDGEGRSPGGGVTVSIPAGASKTYTVAELESGRGAGLQGSLGDGVGEWRLIVESEQPLMAMSLLSSPSGHLSNLSTVPRNEGNGVHSVPLFPAASDTARRQGLVRVINRSNTAGDIRIKAYDDTQWDYAPLSLSIGAGKAIQFDSNDLEQGNLAKGLAGSTGTGVGDWRLDLTSDLDIEVLSYVRAWDGFLAAMHDVAPSDGTRHRVALFDPRGSSNQESLLRLINTGNRTAEVAISGIDARGHALGGGVTVSVPAGASVSYSAAQLLTGAGTGLRGSLGGSAGEWRLTLESDRPLQVMSLLSSSTGHLSNLSTAPVSIARMPPTIATDTGTPDAQTPEDVFRTEVSQIVQSKCILCHQEAEGFPARTPVSRLQFSPSTVENHAALNLAVFEALIAVLGEDEAIEDPVAHVLNKVQGVGHGGGVQAAAGTDDYASLERFLGLLGGAVAPVAITPETLFAGVTMESPRQTLRRAAIVFAGRAPTQAEYSAVEGGGEEALRTAIRGLMTGPGFHEFLIRASNDRLLTDRDQHVLGRDGFLVEFENEYVRLCEEAYATGEERLLRVWEGDVQYGARRSPLELIAHVVENDLDYRDILTADYIMANPVVARAYGASAEFRDTGPVRNLVC